MSIFSQGARELEKKIRYLTCISGTVKYEVQFRNVWYKASCHDTLSYDRIRENEELLPTQRGSGGLTYLQALKALYRKGVPEKDWKGRKTAE